MKKLAIILALLVSVFASTAQAQVTPVYEGHYDVQPYGNDSTYMRAFTHRYVAGELRFLSLTHRGDLLEFRKPGTFGTAGTGHVRSWSLSGLGALDDFTGIWFEQAQNRLWVSSGPDYTANYSAARVTILTLNDSGTVTVSKQFDLSVPGKRAYGGCNAVPVALRAQLGGAYVCGFGGYTSLVAQGGGASIGPTMYAIPDPAAITNGSTVTVRVVLDAAASRGVRATIPVNFFDGGDPRQNPATRPTGTPLTTAAWLSPNAQGQGWMVWGDSYYNTGMWIGNTFASVASLCKGSCWYQSSTLAFDDRQFEFHQWNGAGLGSDLLKRPDVMTELALPRGNTQVWGGNSSAGNITGASYDATTGHVYLLGYPLGSDVYTGRLYQLRVSAGAPTPPPVVEPPPPPPPVEPPPVVPPPVTPPAETITHADLKAILDRIETELETEPLVTFAVTITSIGSSYANGDRRLTIRVPLASMPASPTNGATLRVVKE